MPEEIYYSKDPIVEAIIAVEVEGTCVDSTEDFDFDLDGYPSSERIQQGQFTFDIRDASAKANVKPFGRKFTSADGKQVVQFKPDGFIFSRLAPYNGWAAFSSEAKRLWEMYSRHLGESCKAKTLVVRYVNKLILPFGPDIDAYFRVYAFFPEDYTVKGRSYLLRVELLIDDPASGILTMQHATLPEQHPNGFAFLVDHEFKFPVSGIDLELWALVQKVQLIKNQTFKRILTPLTEEMIK